MPLRHGRLHTRVGDWVCNLLWHTGLSHPRHRHTGHLTIVTFHRVLPDTLGRQYPFPGLSVTPDALRFCLAHFRRHYECLPLLEAHTRWLREDPPPRPLLALTFDDGTLDNHDHAEPILREADVRATFFVPVDAVTSGEPLWHDRAAFAMREARHPDPVGAVERLKHLRPAARTRRVAELTVTANPVPPWAGMMTWEHVRSLADRGHEIGSHSMSHPLLPQCPRAQKHHELAGSKHALERHLGRPILTVAYPNGDADPETLRVAEEAGYALGVTTRWGTNRPGAHPLTLRRCDMDARRMRRASDDALHSPRLAWRLSGLHPHAGRR